MRSWSRRQGSLSSPRIPLKCNVLAQFGWCLNTTRHEIALSSFLRSAAVVINHAVPAGNHFVPLFLVVRPKDKPRAKARLLSRQLTIMRYRQSNRRSQTVNLRRLPGTGVLRSSSSTQISSISCKTHDACAGISGCRNSRARVFADILGIHVVALFANSICFV
jgi:hypothetical protein